MPFGGLISVAVLIPNILWVLFPSSDVSVRRKDGMAQSPRALVFVEQVARLGVFAVPFFYTFAPLQPIERAALVVLFAALGVYYLCWFRYFTRGRSIGWLYHPLVGVDGPHGGDPRDLFRRGERGAPRELARCSNGPVCTVACSVEPTRSARPTYDTPGVDRHARETITLSRIMLVRRCVSVHACLRARDV